MDIVSTLKQVALSLFVRRKKWIALTVAGVLLLFLPLAYLLSREPPRYQTTATIFLESKAGSPLFEEFSPFRPLSVQLAILQSRALGQSVIEALPRASVQDLIANPYGHDYQVDIQNWFRRLRGEAPVVDSPEVRALEELRAARVAFFPQGASGIVLIRAEASNPRVALDIVNTYVEVLLARTRSFNVDDAKSTRDYLQQQGAQVTDALQSSEKNFQEFTMAKGGIKVPDRVGDIAARLNQLETTLAEVQANRGMSQNRLTALRAKLDAMPARRYYDLDGAPLTTPRAHARPAGSNSHLAEAKIRYTD